jgi:ABC-2 type transport system ATP-binding protein
VVAGRENLRLMADLHHLDKQDGTTRANALLEQFGLEEVADRPVAGHSGGLQRRLDMAMTLLGEPRALFLDEPTTGLDPRSRLGLWDAIRSMVDRGMTVLLTTQYLEEADALADRVVLLNNGRLVAEGTPQELKALVPGGHIRVVFPDAASFARAAAHIASIVAIDEGGLTLQVPSDGTAESLLSILTRLEPPSDARVAVVQPGLDDVFLALTEGAR